MITDIIDPVRGCGKRKAGGLYLMAGTNFSDCCALPIPLTVCPCCGQGIKFFRGFGWIMPAALFDGIICHKDFTQDEKIDRVALNKNYCIIERLPDKMGLMWVGEMFYTPQEFTREAEKVGISKRIRQLPNDFEVGKTWLALAHRKAVPGPEGFAPGVFMFFKPARIEYVVRGDETTDFLERLEKKGITLVNVVGHEGEQLEFI